jgi:hypothetical protein
MLEIDKLESCLIIGILNNVEPIKEFALGVTHSTKVMKLRAVIFVPTDKSGLQQPLPREKIEACKTLSELQELFTSPTSEDSRGREIIWINSA